MESLTLTLHLFGVIFFVGGQMAMVAAVTPTLGGREGANQELMRGIAMRFGIGSAVALVLIIATGVSMASDDNRWGNAYLHAKLLVLAIIFVLTAVHTKVPYTRALSLLIFVLSLVLVVLGVQLSES